jgi:thiamine-monophosphate kinase
MRAKPPSPSSRRRLQIRDVGEIGLLKLIERHFARDDHPGVLVTIGDDAAVLTRVSPSAVLSTDMLVEDVDFDFAWASWADVGHKAASANLSDLAAMGARARCLLLALGLRPQDRVKDVLALVAGFAATGARFGAPLVGGDLSKVDGPLIVGVTVVGEADPRRTFRRRRARPGDVVLVSGTLGAAAAGLTILERGRRTPRALVVRQLRPEPQLALGRSLAAWGRVTSAADISDGLSRDALHLAPPGCGVVIDVALLPIAPGVAAAACAAGTTAQELALQGGEDFELVLAVRPRDVRAAVARAKRLDVRLTVVGRVVSKPGLHLAGARGRSSARGFDHFR